MPQRIVIFGATSNVAKRYVFPGLSRLLVDESSTEECTIIGVGRRDWTTSQFQEYVSELLGKHKPPLPKGCRENFLTRLEYTQVEDLSDAKRIGDIFSEISGVWLLYLGLPPQLYFTLLTSLTQVEIPDETRIIVEKPFGLDYEEAKALNQILHKQFPEKRVFRMDHFLGKAVVSSILRLRFDSHVLAPLWNNRHVEKVEVIWDETLALEGRAEYYDRAGALKDMIQSHLLQILAVLTLEPMESTRSMEFRDKRVDLFRSIRTTSKAEIQAHTVRARYQSGRVRGKQIPAYGKEPGINPKRNTETFAQVTFWIDNERWGGVPFVLRSGKALEQDRMEIGVYFKNVDRTKPSIPSHDGHDVLRFDLDSEEVNLNCFTIKKPNGMLSDSLEFAAKLPYQSLPPYGRMFEEAMSGNQRLFIRNDEIEEMWKIVQPIADGWTNNAVPLRTYPAGSKGPTAAQDIK